MNKTTTTESIYTIFKKNKFVAFIFVTFGTFLMSVSLYFFLEPLGLITGGVTGVSVLFSQIWESFPTSYFILICNIVFLIIGLIFFGKIFFIKTVYSTILCPVFIFIFELTLDPRLILDLMDPSNVLIVSSITTPLLLGFGIGLVLRTGATTGGIDVVQMILHKKLKVPFSLVMVLTDGLIVALGFVYYIINKQLDLLFFSIIIVFVTSKIIDRFTIQGQKGYTFMVISAKYKEIEQILLTRFNHGVTRIECKGSYTGETRQLLLCNVYSVRLVSIKELIMSIDKDAFFFVVDTKEIWGEGFKWN